LLYREPPPPPNQVHVRGGGGVSKIRIWGGQAPNFGYGDSTCIVLHRGWGDGEGRGLPYQKELAVQI